MVSTLTPLSAASRSARASNVSSMLKLKTFMLPYDPSSPRKS
jgi:hypothetical protein